MFGYELPVELRDLLGGYEVRRVEYYASHAEVYVLEGGGGRRFLKVAEGGGLGREWRLLSWIGGRLPVPAPIWYGAAAGRFFLVWGVVVGTPVYLVKADDRGDAVVQLARALKMIHSLDPEGCPFTHPLEEKLKAIMARYGVDSPEAEEMRRGKPEEAHVFTHGDYCLPNVLVEREGLSGVIDWDYGGLADPYVDFASAVWSLGYNFGEPETEEVWAPLFFEEYGMELDEGKLEYFRRINALID